MGKANKAQRVVKCVFAILLLGGALAGCDARKPPADSKPSAAAANPAQDITGYAARRAGCNHWGGEEGTDAARRAEINRAMTALKCDRIDQDEAGLLKRYSDQPQQLQHIRAAHDKLL
jgi:hypothetical protein